MCLWAQNILFIVPVSSLICGEVIAVNILWLGIKCLIFHEDRLHFSVLLCMSVFTAFVCTCKCLFNPSFCSGLLGSCSVFVFGQVHCKLQC